MRTGIDTRCNGMEWLRRTTLALVSVAIIASAAGTAGAASLSAPAQDDLLIQPSKMTFPPLEFKPPKAKRLTLSNGIPVYVLEDHELPLIDLAIDAKTGAYLEPADKVGLAEITGAVMRTGGTETMTGDQLDEELEFRAASIEAGIGGESGWASLNVLTKDWKDTLPIFAQVVMHPRFDPKKLELKKAQVMEGIRRWNDEPGDIARREFRRLVYGSHPFGRVAHGHTIKSITRDDALAFYKRSFAPSNLIIAVSGDFQTDAMMKDLEAAFGSWKSDVPKNPDPPEVPLTEKGGIFYIEKDVPQTNIRMGHVGVKELDPDYFTMEVMDSILGGNGFVSRLMREVRSNRGLAYDVGSFMSAGQTRGLIGEACGTKAASTLQSIQLMQEITASMTKAEPTAEELQLAKDSILQSFVFEFQSAALIAQRQASLELNHLPPDWLTRFKEGISKVTAADVLAATKRHLFPDKMILLVVGNQKDFDAPLSKLGPVTTRPLEDYSK